MIMIMKIATYTQLRKNLSATLDGVLDDHDPVLITRGSKEPVVMISFDDYNAYEETLYLAKRRKNRQRLLESVRNVKKGDFCGRKLKK